MMGGSILRDKIRNEPVLKMELCYGYECSVFFSPVKQTRARLIFFSLFSTPQCLGSLYEMQIRIDQGDRLTNLGRRNLCSGSVFRS